MKRVNQLLATALACVVAAGFGAKYNARLQELRRATPWETRSAEFEKFSKLVGQKKR